MKLKTKRRKKIKSQFVLSVGDEGAILCFYKGGKLENRIFVDSPLSPDIKLLEKLLGTYQKIPIRILVDVMEQNYSQQFLPPVSPIGIKQQVNRKLKRDFQPTDLNNVLPLGRSSQGRRDWSFLFISLANVEPFSRWFEFVLSQKNKFAGVYLLPIESSKLIAQLRGSGADSKTEWEVLVMHNKIGGFRIVVLRSGKLVFTRLAQNLIGDNISDIVVGNLEQEIANTVEYLRRLGFKGEQDSKIIIIAATDIIQKVDAQTLKFGKVELLTPFNAAEKLGLPSAVNEKDKFSDILAATKFAADSRHVLKFNSPYSKKIELLYLGITMTYLAGGAVVALMLFNMSSEIMKVMELRDKKSQVERDLITANAKMRDIKEKESKLPSDYKRMQEILEISRLIPRDDYFAFRLVKDLEKVFGPNAVVQNNFLITKLEYKRTNNKIDRLAAMNEYEIMAAAQQPPPPPGQEIDKFDLEISFEMITTQAERDKVDTYVKKLMLDMSALFPQYKVDMAQAPSMESNKFEAVNTFDINQQREEVLKLQGRIKLSGGIR